MTADRLARSTLLVLCRFIRSRQHRMSFFEKLLYLQRRKIVINSPFFVQYKVKYNVLPGQKKETPLPKGGKRQRR
jgi:hypothetical protein